MTIIAFDGRYVAADRRMTFGHEISRHPSTKLQIAGGAVFAGTGYIHQRWREHLVTLVLNDGEHIRGPWRNEPGNFVRCQPDGFATSWSDADPFGVTEQSPCAWGRGSDFATGAMLAGADAMRAVEIACKLDNTCGGGVQFVDLADLDKGVQTWARENPALLIYGDDVPPVPTQARRLRDMLLNEKPETYTRIIEKPRKIMPNDEIPYWQHDCTGKLTLGTGCGSCLRCNREWHALKREAEVHLPPIPPAVGMRATVTKLDYDMRTGGVLVAETEPVTVHELPPKGENHQLDVLLGDARDLDAWVLAYNEAQAAYDMQRVRELDDQLRTIQFPAGCELIAHAPDAEHNYWRREVIWPGGERIASDPTT